MLTDPVIATLPTIVDVIWMSWLCDMALVIEDTSALTTMLPVRYSNDDAEV